MKRLRDDPRRVVILGAGSGGLALLDMLLQEDLVSVVAVVDRRADAPGMLRAAEHGIPVYTDIEKALEDAAPCVAFNLTENEMVEAVASDILGAGGIIGGLEAKLIWRMVTDLRAAKERLEFQATHDELTGLHNRRYLLEEMEREIHQSIRHQIPLSLVLIDLDHFKSINDTYGHAFGDTVLKHTSQALAGAIRAADVLGRWGGEEFLVLLPHCTIADAKIAVEKWFAAFSRNQLAAPDGSSLKISFSAGITALGKQDMDLRVSDIVDVLLGRADEALYAAKDAGRGCVRCT